MTYNKIFKYIFLNKIKYIFITIIILSLTIQVINFFEITKALNINNISLNLIIYLSFLKLPSLILELMPFIIIISTAFFYRNLIRHNELVSIRNIGFSILDIYLPVGAAILLFSLLCLIFINPISCYFQNKYESIVSNNDSSQYIINFNKDNVWMKNKSKETTYYIKSNNFDLKKMKALDIMVLEYGKNNKNIYIAEEGYFKEKIITLKKAKYLNLITNEYYKISSKIVNIGFEPNDILNSVTFYKNIPFYDYYSHLTSLKKLNLYSNEIGLFYISEILKPVLNVFLGFIIMGFAAKFKRNETFFKTLFITILIGFLFYLFDRMLNTLTINNLLPFYISYFILISTTFLIGTYLSIKVERS